jgi:N-acetylglucosaminyl-diphospho-decaprenol L-rhamnosyltransferase
VSEPLSSNRHVAVVIVGYRNPADVSRCLQALATSTYSDFTVYICENGGDDSYRELVRAVPQRLSGGQPVVTVNPGENLGYAGGINRCLEAAGDTYQAAWILNPDTQPGSEALAALLRRLDRGDVEAVGGVMVAATGLVQGYGGRWRPSLAAGTSIGLLKRLDEPVDPAAIEAEQAYLIGASMLVSRRFVDVVGPMQADYFLYVEEVEWCLRARRRGLRLGFAPDAVVWHEQGTTTGWSGPFHTRPKLSIYLDARNRVRLTAQMTPWFLATAVPYILAHALWRYARRGAWRQVGYVFQGVLAGLRGETGRPSWVEAGRTT